jgi:NAD(P)-dependent dehydrogenase (short-subunit alcohol dehydrogenase family)
MNAEARAGRVALVTGGARGIGRAICLALAREGAAVAAMDLNGPGAEETAALARGLGVPAFGVSADVSDYDAVKAALARIREQLGDPSIVVCNAGIAGEPALFRDETKAAWKRQFEVHVDGAYHAIRETLHPMLQSGWGRIVVISSIAARLGWRGAASYAAAKGALLGLMRTLALECASKGITVNAVLPGVIDTEMSRTALVKVRDKLEAAIPMKYVGEPEDIANAVAFLCSDRASYITGQCISPNGGMWMG